MGEEVLLSLKTLHLAGTKKLRARFVGPFRVLERCWEDCLQIGSQGEIQRYP